MQLKFYKQNMMKFQIILGILLFTVNCSSLEATKGKKLNACYRLNDFEVVFKECKNCSQILTYEAAEKINSLIENYGHKKKYLAEVSVLFSREAISIRSDSVSMRDKISLRLKYEIIRNKKIIGADQILQIDTKPLSKSTFSDFISEEKLSVQLLDDALDELKRKLIVFTLEHSK
ncbi:MAG: hypothetical protein MRQ11_00410 [Candidatus Midichloria mitochondrii]|nr:hypothetical protein [Candidatus Midichloria mitochondrii]MDJ1287632.1 hypothetical protein [Candidatus Midichloria mitochondrii]MDJ1298455.1 hypothetical protein [Candidatus Midichloria mitochondrii]MDJ1312548.1 hypothetical protein [Candidatus Midichloria mitochondrii]MDJ1583159.1 hypothetical protein [Candidatus Midichloria mitochondrii]